MKFLFEVHIQDGHTAEEYADAWVRASKIIQQAPGARGTELHRKIGDPDTLIAIASWESKAQRDAMETQHNPDVAAIIRSAAPFVEIRPIGEFDDPEWVVMPPAKESASNIRVFYDGACPGCQRDRRQYERLAGRGSDQVEWVDITGKDEELKAKGIDPKAALQELHVEDQDGVIHSELDAYALLMSRAPLLKPLAWLITLPLIRPLLSRLYHRMVTKRLERTGRMP
ncbi:putative thiol-disulfide oxidoreductase YuxK, DCC family [Marinobacter subterrani]|uniref:Putative thiol-disulfide oxidoreductase YuxK, DCC family n=1 Tax=Marinobacter subterrani TaxID=1658765 RepID=A0A0J7J5L0_9GAMM|nr:putative thiol-disulfide oxidoreductase YuxK, DCC family [Marinobacter subterrani]